MCQLWHYILVLSIYFFVYQIVLKNLMCQILKEPNISPSDKYAPFTLSFTLSSMLPARNGVSGCLKRMVRQTKLGMISNTCLGRPILEIILSDFFQGLQEFLQFFYIGKGFPQFFRHFFRSPVSNNPQGFVVVSDYKFHKLPIG